MGCRFVSFSQTSANSGTEFWTAFPSHEADIDKNYNILYANFSLFITSAGASSGIVTVGAFSQQFSVAANAVVEIQIPRSVAYIDYTNAGLPLSNRAIHILVDPGKPKIVVYAHIFAGQRSAASLILPKEALGTQYYSVNYPQYGAEGKNYIVVIATQANTKVRITASGVDLVPGGITLEKVNDVYEYLSDTDLTGVSVSADASSSCTRFAMFCGSSGVRIGTPGCDPISLDPLFQQGYAVENWGLTYGFIPFSMQSPGTTVPVRTEGQLLRVVAKDNGTDVSLNGKVVATLNEGQFYTTPTPLTQAAVISATRPVSVAQYALSQACANVYAPLSTDPPTFSDPDMVILNPVEYSIKEITTYSSTRENISEQYVNILIKTNAASSFRVNDSVPSALFIPLRALPGYSYLQLNLNSYSGHTFKLSADDGFNAIAYGFGNLESYAYSAGTNLASIQSITGIITTTGQPADSACVNDNFYFKLTLPYRAASISWKMDDNEAAILQTAPTSTSVTSNGKAAYEYVFPRTPSYQNPGQHHILIKSAYPLAGSCETGTQQIEYLFFVKDAPVASILPAAEGCPNIIDFRANSNSYVNHWMWDFGDGTSTMPDTSSLQNPSHTFLTNGVYHVSLVVSQKNGCEVSTTADITINAAMPFPQLTFDAPETICITDTPMSFSNARETTGVAGIKNFSGDGVGNDGVFYPAKAGIGKHEITFSFTTNSGCSVNKTVSVDVLPSPFVSDTVLYVLPGQPTVLKPRYAKGTFDYQWQPATDLNTAGNPFPVFGGQNDITYTVTVKNKTCSQSAYVKVILRMQPETVNTFTPNGDDINDTWQIKNIESYPNLTVTIFNRYGKRVFFSAGYHKPWDGNYQGKPVPVGVYYYLIDLHTGAPIMRGSVSVIR